MESDKLFDVLDLTFTGKGAKKKRDSKAKALRRQGWLVQIESSTEKLQYNLFAQRNKKA